jgi:hypothetical protein
MPQQPAAAQSFRPPPVVAAMLLLALAGCEASRTIASYPVPENPTAEAAAWPRLVDGPTHFGGLEPGPDTAVGAAAVSALTAEARAQDARARALSEPVVDVDALRRDARRAQAGR